MKTKKVFSAAVLALALFALSATPANESKVQCGVSNAQIEAYLEGAPHYHTVFWVEDIPGTCNSKAGIENCEIATVYVSDGRITGHIHSSGGCPQ